MSVELSLCTRILWVLNPSIVNIMTKGSSWGYFTPLASSLEKNMSLSIRLCFIRDILWMLFTCLWYDFLRDLNDPPVDCPPVIVFISSIILGGRWGIRSSSLGEASHLSLSSLQFSFSYELLYLLFQVSTILCVMTVILVEMEILLIMHVGWRM